MSLGIKARSSLGVSERSSLGVFTSNKYLWCIVKQSYGSPQIYGGLGGDLSVEVYVHGNHIDTLDETHTEIISGQSHYRRYIWKDWVNPSGEPFCEAHTAYAVWEPGEIIIYDKETDTFISPFVHLEHREQLSNRPGRTYISSLSHQCGGAVFLIVGTNPFNVENRSFPGEYVWFWKFPNKCFDRDVNFYRAWLSNDGIDSLPNTSYPGEDWDECRDASLWTPSGTFKGKSLKIVNWNYI